MPHTTKRTFGALLSAAVLICFSYMAAQQTRSQQPRRTQNAKPQSAQPTPQQQPQQQNDQLRDQLGQLQMQVKDLQAAIEDLRSERQVIAATAKETRGLVLDTRVAQAQGREALNSLAKAVGQNERQTDQLGRQVSSMLRDLQRVKTKVGLF